MRATGTSAHDAQHAIVIIIILFLLRRFCTLDTEPVDVYMYMCVEKYNDGAFDTQQHIFIYSFISIEVFFIQKFRTIEKKTAGAERERS